MRVNKINGLPDEGVCDVQHTVHSDELFVMRRKNKNGQPDEGLCDIRHTVHSNELFRLGKRTPTVQLNKMRVIRDKQVWRLILEQVHRG